jgi:hypothetical protein
MSVCCEHCVLSGRGLCDELITHSEEPYWEWSFVVCHLETSRTRRPWPALGRSATGGDCRFTINQSSFWMPMETFAFVTNYSKSPNSKAEINYRQTISSFHLLWDWFLQ